VCSLRHLPPLQRDIPTTVPQWCQDSRHLAPLLRPTAPKAVWVQASVSGAQRKGGSVGGAVSGRKPVGRG